MGKYTRIDPGESVEFPFEITLDSLKDGPSRQSEVIHNNKDNPEWYQWKNDNWVRIEPPPKLLLRQVLAAIVLFLILLFVWMAA